MPDFQQPDRRVHPDGIHRDRWTRPIYYMPDDPGATTKCTQCDKHVAGRPYTRMTKFVDVLDDKGGLQKYWKRQIAKGMAIKEPLALKAANALDPDDEDAEKRALDLVCEEAEEAAGTSDKADRGTELHKTVEKILRGGKPKIPTAYKADIQALHDALASHRLNAAPNDLEVNVVIDGVRVQTTAYGVGGRFDLVVTTAVPCPTCGAARRVADFKTGRVWYHGCDRKSPCDEKLGLSCPKRRMYGADGFRMQLAGYALAKRYDPATGERHDLGVCQCIGYVIHLPAGVGVCDLYEADLVRGRAGLAKAYEMWQWRDSEGELPPVPLPDASTSTDLVPANGPDIRGLISLAADRRNLEGLWAHFDAEGQWTEEHTLAAKRRLAELEGAS